VARPSEAARGSLIERRQRRVRRELVNTAMELFFEKGYEATTVEEIVDAVEISPSTFYRHFPTKSDVVVEFSRLQLQAIGDAVAERPTDEPLTDSLCAAVMASAVDLDADPLSLKHFEELIAGNNELRGRLLADLYSDLPIIAASIAPRLGLQPTDLRTEVLATAIASAARIAFAHWARSEEGIQPSEALQTALSMLGPLFEKPSNGMEHHIVYPAK
jgi:AcrR family transcriptional regulator